MTSKMSRRTTYGRAWRSTLSVLIFLLSLPALTIEEAVNTIRSIRTVQSGIEIELNSTRPFPVRNEITVLRIGGKQFTISRYPEDGSLNTLIFTLSFDEFGQTATGDPVTVQYGRGEEVVDRWDFGRLNKSQLNQ